VVTDIPVTVTDVAWLLVSETVNVLLEDPTAVGLKVNCNAESVIGFTPVAESGTLFGVLLPVEFTVRVPAETGPRAVGSTTTAMLQVFPVVRLSPAVQVVADVEMEYGPPVTGKELIVIELAPVFFTVTVLGRLA
jgi:hypothetical protein